MFRCHRRRTTRHRRLHKPNNWWRNPLVVFVLTFLALGSLRFRDRTTALRRNTNKSSHSMPSDASLIRYEQSLIANGVLQYKAVDAKTGQPVTVQQWAQTLLQQPKDSDALTNALVTTVPYDAYFWENRPVIDPTKQEMEFVVVNAPELASFARRNPDERAFAEHFAVEESSATSAVVFQNLGGDARLIAPMPQKDMAKSSYSDLAAFLRGAPTEQIRETWKVVAGAYLDRCASEKGRPVWLSTCGLGIAWLHFRLDSEPKFYTHEPYKLSPKELVPEDIFVPGPSPRYHA